MDYAYQYGRLYEQRRELLRRLDELLMTIPYPSEEAVKNAHMTSRKIHEEIDKRETDDE